MVTFIDIFSNDSFFMNRSIFSKAYNRASLINNSPNNSFLSGFAEILNYFHGVSHLMN